MASPDSIKSTAGSAEKAREKKQQLADLFKAFKKGNFDDYGDDQDGFLALQEDIRFDRLPKDASENLKKIAEQLAKVLDIEIIGVEEASSVEIGETAKEVAAMAATLSKQTQAEIEMAKGEVPEVAETVEVLADEVDIKITQVASAAKEEFTAESLPEAEEIKNLREVLRDLKNETLGSIHIKSVKIDKSSIDQPIKDAAGVVVKEALLRKFIGMTVAGNWDERKAAEISTFFTKALKRDPERIKAIIESLSAKINSGTVVTAFKRAEFFDDLYSVEGAEKVAARNKTNKSGDETGSLDSSEAPNDSGSTEHAKGSDAESGQEDVDSPEVAELKKDIARRELEIENYKRALEKKPNNKKIIESLKLLEDNLKKVKITLDILTMKEIPSIAEHLGKEVVIEKILKKNGEATNVDHGAVFEGRLSFLDGDGGVGCRVAVSSERGISETSVIKKIGVTKEGDYIVETQTSFYRIKIKPEEVADTKKDSSESSNIPPSEEVKKSTETVVETVNKTESEKGNDRGILKNETVVENHQSEDESIEGDSSEFNSLDWKVNDSRVKYIELYRAQIKKEKDSQTRWGKIKSAFVGLKAKEDNDELNIAKKEYDDNRRSAALDFYQAELDKIGVVSVEEMSIMEAEIRFEALKRYVTDEAEVLQREKVEGMPVREKGTLMKVFEAYAGMSKSKKIAIGMAIASGLALAAGTGAVGAAFAGGRRIVSGMAGAAVGATVASGFEYAHKKNESKKNENLDTAMKVGDKLDMDAINNFEAAHENILTDYSKKQKRLGLAKFGITVATGIGATFAAGSLFDSAHAGTFPVENQPNTNGTPSPEVGKVTLAEAAAKNPVNILKEQPEWIQNTPVAHIGDNESLIRSVDGKSVFAEISSKGPEGTIIKAFKDNPELAKAMGVSDPSQYGVKAHEIFLKSADEALKDAATIAQLEKLGYAKDLNGYTEMMSRIGSGAIKFDLGSDTIKLVGTEFLKHQEHAAPIASAAAEQVVPGAVETPEQFVNNASAKIDEINKDIFKGEKIFTGDVVTETVNDQPASFYQIKDSQGFVAAKIDLNDLEADVHINKAISDLETFSKHVGSDKMVYTLPENGDWANLPAKPSEQLIGVSLEEAKMANFEFGNLNEEQLKQLEYWSKHRMSLATPAQANDFFAVSDKVKEFSGNKLDFAKPEFVENYNSLAETKLTQEMRGAYISALNSKEVGDENTWKSVGKLFNTESGDKMLDVKTETTRIVTDNSGDVEIKNAFGKEGYDITMKTNGAVKVSSPLSTNFENLRPDEVNENSLKSLGEKIIKSAGNLKASDEMEKAMDDLRNNP